MKKKPTYEELEARIRVLTGVVEEYSAYKSIWDSFFDRSVDLLCTVGFDRKFKSVNPAWEKTLGWPVDELLGRPYDEFVRPEDKKIAIRAGKTAREKAEPVVEFENRYRCKDGSFRWLSWNAVPVPEKQLTYGIARDVTMRVNAVAALKESEEKYRSLFENESDAVLIFDAKTLRFEDANPATLSLFGYSREDFLNLRVEDISAEKDKTAQAIRGILEEDAAHRKIPLRIMRKSDGTLFPGEICSGKFESGGRLKIIGAVRDISHRLEIENALTSSSRFLQSTIDALMSNLAILDESGTIQFVNDSWRAFADENDLAWEDYGIGKNYLEICRNAKDDPSSNSDAIIGILEEMLSGGRQFFQAEYPCHSPDQERWFVGRFSRFVDGILPRIVVSHIDITERKRSELALLESKELFQQLTAHIDEVFWLFNRERSEFLYISPAFDKIWGVPRKIVLDDPGKWFDTLHDQDRANTLIGQRMQAGVESKWEYRILRPDDQIRWIQERCFPIFDDAGTVYRIAGVARDVTEEKALKRESEYRLQQIVQADRLASLGEMVAGVAHEINNPNSFITYNVPLLEETWEMFKPILKDYRKILHGWKRKGVDYDDLMQDMTEIIDAIRVGSDRINEVVTNLKDFARLDESAQKQMVKINEVVEKTMMIIGAQLRKSVSRIDLLLGEEVPDIPGHSRKLEQVLANLLVNAGKAAADAEGGAITLTTRFVKTLNAVLVEIEDNGAGLEQDKIKRVFEPFYTTRRSRGGTGLGLSVSFGLVREHNGVIGVMSRKGLGSRFTVFLPVDEAVPVSLHPTIMCVDDEPKVTKLLRAVFLKAESGLIRTTQKPEDVLAFLENHPEVDVVMTDITMPKMDGWQLLEKIKTRFPLMPVVLYSGFHDRLKESTGTDIEPDAVLKKPFDRDELVQTVRSLDRQQFFGMEEQTP